MKLNGAIIGLGNIATRGHIPGFIENPELREVINIVAVMDVVNEHRETVSKMLPRAKYYTDIESLLRHEKIDFVDICSPPFTHAMHMNAFADKGVHIICEKPLTERLQSARQIAATLEKTDNVFVPCHQYKYSPLWKAIHDSIQSSELGRITFAQFNVFRLQADTGTSAWNPLWRTDKEHSGGGILVDTGAHYFYLIQYLFGMPANLISVLRTLKHPEYRVEDTAIIMFDYSDKLVQINLTWAASHRANSILIAGTEGSLSYDGSKLLQSTSAGTKEIPMPNIADKSQYVQWYSSLFNEFYNRVREKNYSKDLLKEAVRVMELLDMSYNSVIEPSPIEV